MPRPYESPRRPRRPPITVKQELEVVGLSSRHPITEIAEITGVPRSTVRRIRRKYHVVARFGRQHAAARRWAYDEEAWTAMLDDMLHRRGMTIAATAAELGRDARTISRRMQALGIRDIGRVEQPRWERSPERVWEIVRLAERGVSYSVIAERLEITVPAVKGLVYRARKRGELPPATPGRRHWTPEIMDTMIDLRGRGDSNRAIARAVGISEPSVRRWFRDAEEQGWVVPPPMP